MNYLYHCRILIFLFSVGIYSCSENKKQEEKEIDSMPAVKVDSSVGTKEALPVKDSVYQLMPLNEEALKFKEDHLNDPDLMNMEQKETIVKYDLSSLFTQTASHQIFGFIGDRYQRIQIKFESVTKNMDQPDRYTVVGVTRVKNNICTLKGTMKVVAARQFLENALESDTIREGFILFEYTFYEPEDQKGSGIFSGVAVSYYYMNKSTKMFYDDLMAGADGFSNNLFVGEWKGYKATSAKRCNWGDHRIPNSGDFDIGSGEFMPAEKYRQNGWMDYVNAYFAYPPDQKALEHERAHWWNEGL